MYEVRQTGPEGMEDFARLAAGSYPSFFQNKPENLAKLVEEMGTRLAEDPRITAWGAFAGDAMVGSMLLFDFRMNIHGMMSETSGVGLVAVDLAHKKNRVCKEMIEALLARGDSRGSVLAELYAFRPDFYRRMGFGYGTPMNLYSITPSALPDSPMRSRVEILDTAEGMDDVAACYAREAAVTHGLIETPAAAFRRMKEKRNPFVAAWRGDSGVEGYAVFSFGPPDEKISMTSYDLEVQSMVWENRDALAGLLGFLRSQADQARRIRLPLQDHLFYGVLEDPRDESGAILPFVSHQCSRQGAGIMYRLIDTARFVERCMPPDAGRFMSGSVVELDVKDGFMPSNDRSVTFRIGEERACLVEGGRPDVTVSGPVGAISSILMGSVGLAKAWELGLVEVTDAGCIDNLDRALRPRTPPVCLTQF